MVYPTVWWRACEKNVPDSLGPSGAYVEGGTVTSHRPSRLTSTWCPGRTEWSTNSNRPAPAPATTPTPRTPRPRTRRLVTCGWDGGGLGGDRSFVTATPCSMTTRRRLCATRTTRSSHRRSRPNRPVDRRRSSCHLGCRYWEQADQHRSTSSLRRV